ncbi:hypothetical protein ACFSVK_23965 [Azorhizophilus paspali]
MDNGDSGMGSDGNDDGGDGGNGNGGNGNRLDKSNLVRLSPAYLAALATKEPCRTADQQLDIRQRYRCPATTITQDRAASESAVPNAIEDEGLRLPKGL